MTLDEALRILRAASMRRPYDRVVVALAQRLEHADLSAWEPQVEEALKVLEAAIVSSGNPEAR